jgi:curved DNA-binding protein CbpA
VRTNRLCNNWASTKQTARSFYRLSKAHHPDHNPNDPNAATRFVKISEAYAVLGHSEKRQRYDRDVVGTGHGSSSSRSRTTPRGSYASSGPAGGRPASGLSRRRTHFQGPPPSFYRSGGWGAHRAKRQAAQEEASSTAYASAGGSQTGVGGGTGPGQRPFGHDNDVPHFDREGHFRTHTNQEQRRQRRMSQGYTPTGPESSTLANFIFVSSIISLGVLIPTFFFEKMTRNRKQEK